MSMYQKECPGHIKKVHENIKKRHEEIQIYKGG